jgi:CHAT domain-containing protein
MCSNIYFLGPARGENNWYQESTDLFKQGHLPGAKEALLKQLKDAKTDEARIDIIDLLNEECLSAIDFECLQDTQTKIWPLLSSSQQSDKVRIYRMWYSALGLSTIPAKDVKKLNLPNNILSSIAWMNNVDSFHYGRIQIYESRILESIGRYEEAYEGIERAKISLFRIPQNNRYFICSYLIDLITGLMNRGNTLVAFKWMAVSEDYLRKWLPINGPDYVRFLILRASIASYFLPASSLLKLHEEAYNSASKIDYPTGAKETMLSELSTDYALIAGLNNDQKRAFDILNSHPLHSKNEDFLSGKSNTNPIVISYAAANVILNKLFNRPLDKRWANVLTNAKNNNDFVKYEDYAEDYTKYMRDYIDFALAIIYRETDPNYASKLISSSAKSRIENIKKTRIRYPDSFPMINIWDRILVEFGVLSGLDTRDADLIISGSEVLDRNVSSYITDAKSVIAAQVDDTHRLIAKSWLLRRQQRYDWEVNALKKYLDHSTNNELMDVKDLASEQVIYSANFTTERGQRPLLEGMSVKPFLPDLKRIQSVLKNGEAVIKINVAAGKLVKYCIRNDFFIAAPVSIIDPKKLTFSIKKIENSLRSKGNPDDLESESFPVEDAYNLWSTISDGLNECYEHADQLIINEPLFLRGIPIEALIFKNPSKNAIGLDRQSWVGVKWIVSYTDSLQALIVSREVATVSEQSDMTYLGIGNPKLNTNAASNIAMRGFKRGSNDVEKISLNELDELPSTSIELDRFSRKIKSTIRMNYPKVAYRFKDETVKLLKSNTATEANFRSQLLSRYNIIHFASHALLREEIPGIIEPSIVLTPVDSNNQINDGLLTTTEISSLELHAGIVILSACNTANLDNQLFGNQLSGLSNAFSFAGVRTIIASLWELHDEATQSLIEFYGNEISNNTNKTIGEIHRDATSAFLKDSNEKRFHHPRYWSSVIILGDSNTLPLTNHLPNISEYVDEDISGEIISASKDLNATYTSNIGPLDNSKKRFSSIITAIDNQGQKLWSVKDNEIAAGPIYDDGKFIISAGYVGSETIRPTLRRFNKLTGEWSYLVKPKNEIGNPIYIMVKNDNIILVTSELNMDKVHIYTYDRSGRLISNNFRDLLPMNGYTSDLISVTNDDRNIIVALQTGKSTSDNNYMNELGIQGKVHIDFSTDFYLLDLQGNNLGKDFRIYGYFISSISTSKDGSIIAVGSKDFDGNYGSNAVVISVKPDSQHKEIWSNPFNPSHGISASFDGSKLSVVETLDMPVELYKNTTSQSNDSNLDNYYKPHLTTHGFNIDRSMLSIIKIDTKSGSSSRSLFSSGLSDIIGGAVEKNTYRIIYGTRGTNPRMFFQPY